MLQLINTSSNAVAANGTLPLTIDFNTNQNVATFDAANGQIVFIQPGIYKVTANFVFSAAAAGANTIVARSGSTGVNVAGMTASFTSSIAAQSATYTLTKDIRVQPSAPGSYARISFLSTTAGTMTNAIVTVEKIR